LWPPFWDLAEWKSGRPRPNERAEEFGRSATIDRSVELIDRCGVLIFVNHPEYKGEGLSGVIIVPSKALASNLARTVKQFLGKTIAQLGEAEVNDLLELTV
jgi:hypothetical protein